MKDTQTILWVSQPGQQGAHPIEVEVGRGGGSLLVVDEAVPVGAGLLIGEVGPEVGCGIVHGNGEPGRVSARSHDADGSNAVSSQ